MKSPQVTPASNAEETSDQTPRSKRSHSSSSGKRRDRPTLWGNYKYRCGNCSAKVRTVNAYVGKNVTCPYCQSPHHVFRPAAIVLFIRYARQFGPRVLLAAILLTGLATTYFIIDISQREIARSESIIFFRNSATTAFEKGDFETAFLHFQELNEIDDLTLEEQYNWAISGADAKTDKTKQAIKIMEGLANSQSQKSISARRWLVEMRMNQGKLSRLDWFYISKHERIILEDDPQDSDSKEILVRALLAIEKNKEAMPVLEDLATTRSHWYASIVDIYLQQDNLDAALSASHQLRKAYEPKLIHEPEIIDNWLLIITTLLKVRDFESAEQYLDRAQRALSDHENPLSDYKADLYLQWAQNLKQSTDPKDIDRAFDYLGLALEASPDSTSPIHELRYLSLLPGKQGERAIKMLHQTLAKGNHPEFVRIILGDYSYSQGDIESAEIHWVSALHDREQSAFALNNLAWLMIWKNNPELQRGLDYANRAVALNPNVPRIRGTRGQAYARLGQFDNALKDLEFALPALPDDGRLNATLAEIYRKKKLHTIAERHQQKADKVSPDFQSVIYDPPAEQDTSLKPNQDIPDSPE